jgi:hypothetical protein
MILTNNNNVEFNADSFLEEARRKAHEKLMPEDAYSEDQHDLRHLLRSANALITMNQEIWERCKEDRCIITNGFLPFSRHSLKVRCDSPKNEDHISVSVQLEVKCKDFGAPPRIPSGLLDLIGLENETGGDAQCKQFEGFPDYRLYLEKQVGLLNDVVLVPFLLKFKEHLESIHVYLGNIESWLLEPSLHAQFLKDLTGEEVSIPNNKPGIWCHGGTPCCVKHPPSSICLKCHNPFEYHENESTMLKVGTTPCYRHFCPSGKTSEFKHYESVASQTLLRVPFPHGMMDSEFCLDSETEQRKLKALVGFIILCV